MLLIQLSCFISSALRRIEDFHFHGPRRTRSRLTEWGPLARKHEVDRSFPGGLGNHKGSDSFRTRRVTRPVNTTRVSWY